MNPWFLLAIMSLTTFILTKLVVDLDFPPVLWLRDRVIGGWRKTTLAEDQNRDLKTTDIDGELYRYVTRNDRVPLFFAALMSCPWCTSAWMAAVTVTGTWATVGLPVPVLMWSSTWAIGALMAQHDYA